jgi:molybdenum cofactor cytidylyltransferase
MRITGIILAAGMSSRMGTANKLLLKYKNHTIIEEVFHNISSSKIDDILIITGFEHDRIYRLFENKLSHKIKIIQNMNYKKGRSESIKCAIRDIFHKTDAALFMVADKPGVNHNLINRALIRFKKDIPPILYVKTPNGRGHPIIFSKTLFDEFLKFEGDQIGNDLVNKYAGSLSELDDKNLQIDINNEKDYNLILRKLDREDPQQRSSR